MPGVIAVTGATGFIGRFVCHELMARGYAVRALVRESAPHILPHVEAIATGDLGRVEEPVLDAAFSGAGAVVHLAGRAHVLRERLHDPAAAYDSANRVATDRVAAAAVRAGVERFVLASTVKVHGETSVPGRPFRPDDPVAPSDLYARSKLAAEHALAERCAGSSTSPLVLRLPLVYGPGVGGNFLRLLDAIGTQRRLPLAAVDNRRSLVYVGNLADALVAALEHKEPVRGVHFVADGASVSTPELVRAIGRAMDESPRLVYVPLPLLRVLARVVGKAAELERLCGSLEVDASSFVAATGWTPSFTLEQGIASTARWWRTRHSI